MKPFKPSVPVAGTGTIPVAVVAVVVAAAAVAGTDLRSSCHQHYRHRQSSA